MLPNEKVRRVNIMIRDDQYHRITEEGLSLSGLIRDLLDDRFSDNRIVLTVSKRTKKLYDQVISNFGIDDAEFERFLLQALDQCLTQRSKDIETLRKRLSEKN